LLGPSKTWRGLVAAVLITPLAAAVLALPWSMGLVIALGAMLGDLAVSFAKRRLDISPSSPVFALDEIPESLVPALLVKAPLGLTMTDVIWVVAGFLVVDQVLSPLAVRWRARRNSS
jgi:CDP-2,3-bis-(O-geranylgeranyl)-sn-glycerol synthase